MLAMFVVVVMLMCMVVPALLPRRQEIGIDVEFGIQIEATQVKYFLQGHFAKMHGTLRCPRVHVAQAVLQGIELLRRDQVGLADKDLVGKADLAARLLAIGELLLGVLGVHQRQDGIEQIGFSHFVVHEKGLRHRAGIGQAGGFDHHALKVQLALASFFAQIAQGGAQILADGAADAAVVHLDDLLAGLTDQNIGVNVLFTELVLNDCNLLTMGLVQYTLEQRGLARTQEAGQDGDGNK